ncbi:MAG: GNAT family N-acetyltransferase [Candidatus Saccharibacteria bacterium]
MEPKPMPPENEPTIEIKLCSEADLALLNKAIPAPGYHEKRFAEQEDGKSSYLIAWQNDVPVGHLNLKWEGSGPQVSQYLPNTPELNAIGVWPPEKRSQGIGGQLIVQAEAMAKEKGFKQVALAVSLDNPRAKELYEKHGYKDWGHGEYFDKWTEKDSERKKIQHNDPCYYLVKKLEED